MKSSVAVVVAALVLSACNNSELNLFRIRVLVEDCGQVPAIREAATAIAEAEYAGPGELVGGIQDVVDVACVPEGRVGYGYRVETTGGPLSGDRAWDAAATLCGERYTFYVDSTLPPVLAALGPAIAARVSNSACT